MSTGNVGEIAKGLLAKFNHEQGSRARKDAFFEVRQLEYFRLAYQECQCEGHTCPGCTVLFEVGMALKEKTAALHESDPAGCERETAAARALWLHQRREEHVRGQVIAARERKMCGVHDAETDPERIRQQILQEAKKEAEQLQLMGATP